MSTKDDLERLIIKPIIKARPKGVPPNEYLETVFNLNTRIVSIYYSLGKPVPGHYLTNGIYRQEDIPMDSPLRKTKVFERLIARVDDTMPGLVQIDLRGHVFELTRKEWDAYRPKLKKMMGQEDL